jgi:hypothetical protein
MPAKIGRKYVNEMFAMVGGMTRAGRAERSLAGPMLPSMLANRKSNMIGYGRKAATRAGTVGFVGMTANSYGNLNNRSSYRPARQPINPISSPQGSGRYA